jgi:hypothetical protein
MGGLYDGYGPVRTPVDPTVFPMISYKDADNNGFFETIEFDLDGDKTVDFSFNLKNVGFSDVSKVYTISGMKYADFAKLEKKVADDTWKNALAFVKFAESLGMNTHWYALLKNPLSQRQKYSFGYWLKFYLFMDCLEKAKNENNSALATQIIQTYFGQKSN